MTTNPSALSSLTSDDVQQPQGAALNSLLSDDNSPSQQAAPSGQVTNDVGQQVVTPRDGESFTDTVNRAKGLQRQREQAGTQQQALDAETATIPAKTAQTLGAAAGIGVAGPALLAAPGEALRGLAPFVEHISGQILEHGTEMATKYPNFVKLMGKLVPGLPLGTLATITYAYEHFKK